MYTKGTAGVAIAGLLGAVRAQGRPMIDFPKQRIVVAGAGRSGTLSVFNPFFLSLGLKLDNMLSGSQQLCVYFSDNLAVTIFTSERIL